MSKTLKFRIAEIAEVIDKRHREEPDGWKKTRLLAVKLAAKGEYRAEQVAELCGVVRSRVFAWLKCARKEGLEALLTREKPGPKKTKPPGWKRRRRDEREEGVRLRKKEEAQVNSHRRSFYG